MLEIDRIYCGDSLDWIQRIDDNSVDLVVTSPKYNVGLQYDQCQDMMPWPEYYNWCRKWMREVYRVIKPDGRFCLNHYLSCGTSKHRSAPLMDLNAICEFEIGFNHHGFAVWTESTTCKRQAWGSWCSASAPYVSSPLEGIDILYKDHWKRDTRGESTITKEEFMNWTLGIWKMQPQQSRGGCPAPFPLELPRRCIDLLTYKGDLVLDLFNGSGTTCVAAKQGGRHYIGIDISPAYCEDAREWLETGVRPRRPTLKKHDTGKKRTLDCTPTKYCKCGAIILREETMCETCRWKGKLAKRGEKHREAEHLKRATLSELLK